MIAKVGTLKFKGHAIRHDPFVFLTIHIGVASQAYGMGQWFKKKRTLRPTIFSIICSVFEY
jgi:hypothetical protein